MRRASYIYVVNPYQCICGSYDVNMSWYDRPVNSFSIIISSYLISQQAQSKSSFRHDTPLRTSAIRDISGNRISPLTHTEHGVLYLGSV